MKKKLLLVLAVCIVGTALTGCKKDEKDYTTFPKNYQIASVDVGGMTIEEAGAALETAADSYSVNVKLNDVEFSVTSADLGLHYDSDCDMKALIKAANNGLKKAASNQNNDFEDPEDTSQQLETEGAKNIPVFRCDSDSLLTHMIFLQYVEALELAGNENASSLFNPTKASIKFDKQLQEYVGVDGVSGEAPNYEPVIDALTSAIGNLETTVEAATVNEQCEGEVAAESEAVSKAIEAANTYLDTQLQLQFAFGEPATVIMSKEDIASCLELEVDGLSLKISPSNIADYCNRQIASHQSIEYQDLKYLASNEATYLIPVASGGRRVVGAALYTKIAESLESKSQLTYTVEYSDCLPTEEEVLELGDNRIEIDLTKNLVHISKAGNVIYDGPIKTSATQTGESSLYFNDGRSIITQTGKYVLADISFSNMEKIKKEVTNDFRIIVFNDEMFTEPVVTEDENEQNQDETVEGNGTAETVEETNNNNNNGQAAGGNLNGGSNNGNVNNGNNHIQNPPSGGNDNSNKNPSGGDSSNSGNESSQDPDGGNSSNSGNESAQGPDGGNDSDSGNDQNEDKDNSDPDKGNSGNGAQNPDGDNNDNKDENNSEDTQKPENGADKTQQE